MKIGDKVIFQKLLVDDWRVWNLNSKKEFELIKTLLGTAAIIKYIQKHFADTGAIEYYLDVEFSNGFTLKGVNSLCFDMLNFDYI